MYWNTSFSLFIIYWCSIQLTQEPTYNILWRFKFWDCHLWHICLDNPLWPKRLNCNLTISQCTLHNIVDDSKVIKHSSFQQMVLLDQTTKPWNNNIFCFLSNVHVFLSHRSCDIHLFFVIYFAFLLNKMVI